MWFNIARLSVGITADIQQLRMNLQQGLTYIKAFGQQAGAIAQKTGKTSLYLGAAGAASIAALTKAVSLYGDLQQTISNTASVTGSTESEFAKLEQKAREAGKTTIFNAKQAGDAMYFLASAGYSVNQIFDSLNPILALAAATQYDLSETSAVVVSTLNQYGMEASEAARVTNVLAASCAYSQAEMYKLAVSMRYIGPVAAQMNYTIEDTVGALSLLYDAGLEASMAGTGLRMALVRLQSPTREMRQALRELKVDADDLNPAFNDLVDIIGVLEKANAGAAKHGKQMAEIFGVRAVNAMNILVRNGSDRLQDVIDRITDTNKAAEMQQRQIDNLKGSWALMSGAIREVAYIYGSTLAPAVDIVMKAVRSLALSFAGLPKWIQVVTVAITTLLPVFALFLGSLGMLLRYLPAIITNVKLMSLAFNLFGKQIMFAFGWVGALVTLLTLLFSAGEAHASSIKRLTLEYTNLMDAQITEVSYAKNLAERLKELANVSQSNETLYKRQQKAIVNINKVYPGLIDNNKSLTSQMWKLDGVINETSGALEGLTEEKREFLKVQIEEDLYKAQKRLRELYNSLGGMNWSDVFGGFVTMFRGESAKASKGVNEQFSADFDKTAGRVGESIRKNLNLGLLGIREINIGNFQTDLEEMARTEEGRAEILREQKNIIATIGGHVAEILSLENKLKNSEEGLSIEEAKRLEDLIGVVKVEEALLRVYQKISETTREINTTEKQVADLRAKSSKSAKDTEDSEKKIVDNMGDEVELLRKKKQLEFELQAAAMRNRGARKTKEDEKWYDKMQEEATELGVNMSLVDSAYAERKRKTAYENSMDIAESERNIMEKMLGDVLALRLRDNDIHRKRALEEAMELGTSIADVNKAYDADRRRIERDWAQQKLALHYSVMDRIGQAETEALAEGVSKQKKTEEERHQSALRANELQFKDRLKDVEVGLVTIAEAEAENHKIIEEEAKQHKQRMADIEREHAEKVLEFQTEVANMKLRNDDAYSAAHKSYLDIMLDDEDAAYRDRIAKMEKEHTDQLKAIRELGIDDTELREQQAREFGRLNEQHSAKRQMVLAEEQMNNYEETAAGLDRSTLAYQNHLKGYLAYIGEMRDKTKGDKDAQIALAKKEHEVDKDLARAKKQRNKELLDDASKTAEAMGLATQAALTGEVHAWRDASAQILGILADRLIAEIQAQMAVSMLLGQYWEVAGYGAALGIAYGLKAGAQAQISKGRWDIGSSAVGGQVTSTGMQVVHQGETILPATLSARVQRKPWESYAEGIRTGDGGKSDPNKIVVVKHEMNVNFKADFNAQGAIITPAGTDAQDAFYERVIRPAEKRFKDAMGETLRKNFKEVN